MLTKLDGLAPYAVAVFRIVIGLLFLTHGTSTLFAWPGEPSGGSTPSFGAWPSWWAGAIEVVAGLLIVVGLRTRLAALIGSGTMAVAYFWKHQPDGLFPIENGGQGAALYCWALLLLVFIGPGRWALDGVLSRRTVAAPSGSAVAA